MAGEGDPLFFWEIVRSPVPAGAGLRAGSMLVDDVNMVFRQGVKPAFGLGEGRGHRLRRDLEARFAQPV